MSGKVSWAEVNARVAGVLQAGGAEAGAWAALPPRVQRAVARIRKLYFRDVCETAEEGRNLVE